MMERKGDGPLLRLAQLLGLKQAQVGLLRLLLLAVAVGILLMSSDRLLGMTSPTRPGSRATPVAAPASPDDLAALEAEMARSLEQTLSSIAGAGTVHVRLTLLAGPTVTPFYKTQAQSGVTREKAQDGSTRETTQSNDSREVIVQRAASGQEVMPVMRRSRAEIAGVLVVADGAVRDPVRAQLHRATAIALGIPAHRIEVVPSTRR
jgi:stage III sporulation protein AG